MMAMYDSQPLSFSDIITHDQHDQPPNHHHDSQDDEEELAQTFFVRAKFDYHSTDASSLSLHKGALIEVFNQLPSGWWDGLIGEERGWFPSNYVELVPDEEAFAELAAIEAQAHQQQQQPESSTAAPSESTDPPAPEQSSSSEPDPTASSSRDDFWVPRVTNNGHVRAPI